MEHADQTRELWVRFPSHSLKYNNMKLTKQMIDDKLKQIAIHEKRFGESTKSRAIKKYCLDKQYRKRVDQFTQASLNTIKHYQYAKYTQFN